MKTVHFISLMLFSAIFTLFASCGKEDLSMNPATSSPEIAKLSKLDSLVVLEPIDRLIAIRHFRDYTYVESELVAMSWKSRYNSRLTIVQTEADFLKLFNGPVNVDLDKYTIVATGFTYCVGHAEFVSSFYFKKDEPTNCRWYLDDIFTGNTIQVLTPMSVAIIIPKMEITSVEIFGGGTHDYQTE